MNLNLYVRKIISTATSGATRVPTESRTHFSRFTHTFRGLERNQAITHWIVTLDLNRINNHSSQTSRRWLWFRHWECEAQRPTADRDSVQGFCLRHSPHQHKGFCGNLPDQYISNLNCENCMDYSVKSLVLWDCFWEYLVELIVMLITLLILCHFIWEKNEV